MVRVEPFRVRSSPPSSSSTAVGGTGATRAVQVASRTWWLSANDGQVVDLSCSMQTIVLVMVEVHALSNLHLMPTVRLPVHFQFKSKHASTTHTHMHAHAHANLPPPPVLVRHPPPLLSTPTPIPSNTPLSHVGREIDGVP